MSNSNSVAEQALKRDALRAIEKLRARVTALETARTEPIAIIGLAVRTAGASSVEQLCSLLQRGIVAISEVPADRFSIDDFYDAHPEAPCKIYTRYGGFLDGVDQFDPQFFGISPREAVSMDPQQRLLLETAWQALENA